MLETGYDVSTITLSHSFTTGLTGSNSYSVQRPIVQPVYQVRTTTVRAQTYGTRQTQKRTERPTTKAPIPTSTYRTRLTQKSTERTTTIAPNRISDSDFECGVPNYKKPEATGLVLYGNEAIRGQFPW